MRIDWAYIIAAAVVWAAIVSGLDLSLGWIIAGGLGWGYCAAALKPAPENKGGAA